MPCVRSVRYECVRQYLRALVYSHAPCNIRVCAPLCTTRNACVGDTRTHPAIPAVTRRFPVCVRHLRMCPPRAHPTIPVPRRFPRRGFCGTLLRTRPGISRLFCARAPPTSAAAISGERTDRQPAHGICAGFFCRYIEIASANGYNRLKHMPAVRISAGIKFEKGRYYHENNPHPE